MMRRTSTGYRHRRHACASARLLNASPPIRLQPTRSAGQGHARALAIGPRRDAKGQRIPTVLSDGADGPRSLGEAASIGTVFHVLDW